jgi:23S rRNA pseudouridine2605 synthase
MRPNPARSRKRLSLTSEQLLATRATLWRQRAEPLLTLDDAQSWLLQSGLCLFLPRKAQIPAPAPSFVEACLGETNAMPPRSAIESAHGLLVRLIEAGSALPLNLFGTATDHPDFLVSQEALPFVYALRGDRDWKHAPGTAGANRVSPLVTQVWKLLEKRGVLTAAEIQNELGRELTEAAVLRALHDLWSSLRVVPLYQAEGQETLWEPLQSRHQKAMNSGVGMSQVTALSVLVSVYLQSAVAAAADDAESFLSPLASRSKVREVIRGLTATRQLAMIQMETQALLYVEGSLPEFPEVDKPASDAAAKPVRRAHPTSPEGIEAALVRKTAISAPRPAYKRPAGADGARPNLQPSSGKRSGGRLSMRTSGARPDVGGHQAGSGNRPAASSKRPAFKPKSTFVERSAPGSGLRPDGTPKKTRWRDLPGGRPDQKGKPTRFGPRKSDAAMPDTPVPPTAPRRESGGFRPAAAPKPPYQCTSPAREGKPVRPTGPGNPLQAGRSGRPNFGGRASRVTGRPSSRPAPPGGRPSSFRPERSSGGARPPARSGAGRFVARPESGRWSSPPRRDGNAGEGTGDRKFPSRSPRDGGISPTRPRAGGMKPYSQRSGGSSAPARPYSGRPLTGRPAPSGKSSAVSSTGGRGGSSYKPGGKSFKPNGPRSGPNQPRSGSGAASRPNFGQGPRAAGRPSTKFKKRPERPE